jgi:molecular chaperone DnaK (HSP70)
VTWSDRLARLVGLRRDDTNVAHAALGVDLGLVTQNGFTVLLCCRTALPARFSETFSTQQDEQRVLPVKVYKRNPATSEVEHLGTLVIDEITPAAAGEPEIQVTIVVDTAGRVTASSQEAASGRRKEATLGRVGVTRSKASTQRP